MSEYQFKYQTFGFIFLLKELFYKILEKLKIKRKKTDFLFKIKDISYPVHMRYNSSDQAVYRQIFIWKEYGALNNIPNVRYIVDCGGYIGLTSIYFLHQFPKSEIISIEPDINNFQICQKNLAPYKTRTKVINAAIWSHETNLTTSETLYRDGREWTRQFRECNTEEKGNLKAIDLDTVFTISKFPYIDILKIDIERAEVELFSRNCRNWLNKTKNIAIELHDDECRKVFFNALKDYQYVLEQSGELTICQNIKLKENLCH